MVFPLKYFLHHQSLAIQLLPQLEVASRLLLILCVYLFHALVEFPLKQYKLLVFTTYCDKEFPVLNIHYLTCPHLPQYPSSLWIWNSDPSDLPRILKTFLKGPWFLIVSPQGIILSMLLAVRLQPLHLDKKRIDFGIDDVLSTLPMLLY